MACFIVSPYSYIRGECVTPIVSDTMYPGKSDHRRSPPDIPRIRGEISCVREFHINVTRPKYRAQTRKPYNKRVHSWSNTFWLTLVGHHMTYGLLDSLPDSSYASSIVEIFLTIENDHQCGMEGLNQRLKWISSFPYPINVTGLGFTALQSEIQCWLLFPLQVGTLLAAMIVNWDGCHTSFWSEELWTATNHPHKKYSFSLISAKVIRGWKAWCEMPASMRLDADTDFDMDDDATIAATATAENEYMMAVWHVSEEDMTISKWKHWWGGHPKIKNHWWGYDCVKKKHWWGGLGKPAFLPPHPFFPGTALR